jgi:hypothetical protein
MESQHVSEKGRLGRVEDLLPEGKTWKVLSTRVATQVKAADSGLYLLASLEEVVTGVSPMVGEERETYRTYSTTSSALESD